MEVSSSLFSDVRVPGENHVILVSGKASARYYYWSSLLLTELEVRSSLSAESSAVLVCRLAESRAYRTVRRGGRALLHGVLKAPRRMPLAHVCVFYHFRLLNMQS